MTAATIFTPEIRLLPTDSLNPYENNPKLHPEKQVRQIAACMRECGFINPID